MAENTHISWATHTFNPWIGCTNVGPGCDHCYAENLATKRLGVEWGPGKPRRRTRPANWLKVEKWNREAPGFFAQHGYWPRVFAASLADIFDNEVPSEWRVDYWSLVKHTRNLQYLIVTKRIPNVEAMLPPDWCAENYDHIVLIITVVNQPEADRDIPRLIKLKKKYPWLKIGLSIEPMLGPIDLTEWLDWIDWVITGGESRQLPGSRPLVELEAQWIRDIDQQCIAAGVPHHFKQWGYTIPTDQIVGFVRPLENIRVPWKDGMGRSLDGHERNGFPPTLRASCPA